MAAKKASKGKRYSDAEKTEILAFIDNYGGRGGQSAAAKKYKVSQLTLSNWRKSAGAPVGHGKSSKATKNAAGSIDRDAVLRALAGLGFKIVRLQNALTGEIIEEKIDPKVQKMNLEFGGPKGRASNDVTYVTQTDGQILLTMSLERFVTCTIP